MFNGEIVWITGASSGLGAYMAYEFARNGAIPVLSARREEHLKKVLNKIKEAGGEGMVVPCDIMEEDEIASTVAKIIQTYGKLDLAVANAGFGVVGKIDELSARDWQRQMQGNVTGLALTAKYAIPHLKKSQGRLVLLGSVAAYVGNPNVGAYGASKAAVHSIGKTLRLELKGTGVSCTTIHPGFVDSDITRVDNAGNLHPEAEDPRPKNLIWPTDKAAKVMVKAIYKRKPNYVFTGHGKFMAFLGQYFPGIAHFMMSKLAK